MNRVIRAGDAEVTDLGGFSGSARKLLCVVMVKRSAELA